MLRALMAPAGYPKISRLRGAALLACVAGAALAGGCAGARTAAEAPAGLSLAGTWRLDPQASDDPQKALAKLRAEAQKIINRALEQRGESPPPEPPPGSEAQGRPPRRDPLAHSSAAHIIHEVIERGELLVIRQTPDEIVFDYGTSRRTFTPGARSVVSTEGGVGDQRSGWNNRGYLIVVRAQMGPEVTDSYQLEAGGKRLIEQLHIGPYELPAVDLRRVYTLSSASAPRTLPTTD